MTEPPAPPRRSAWPLAFAIVAIVAMLVAAFLFVFQSLRKVPGEIASGGREVIADLRDLAQAFNSGHVRTSFLSYATKVSGNQYLQFATLEQNEIFQREDRASTLWGQLELPEVVVRATAPVTYTYYLDLEGDWKFVLDGNRVLVEAPAIRFNKPAVDPSRLEYEVRSGSLFRDENAALESLRTGLTAMAHQRAQENTDLVREVGRRKTEDFIATWLLDSFDEPEGGWQVRVEFADERVPILSPKAPEAPAGVIDSSAGAVAPASPDVP